MRLRLRYSLGFLLVVMAAIAFALAGFVVTTNDRIEATRSIVAWIVEDRPIAGFGEQYPDYDAMREIKRFIVVADYLPAGSRLSEDPRVVRMTQAEYDGVVKKRGGAWNHYDGDDDLVIVLRDQSPWSCTLEVSNVFGSLAGHGLDFVCSKRFFKVTLSGIMKWVS